MAAQQQHSQVSWPLHIAVQKQCTEFTECVDKGVCLLSKTLTAVLTTRAESVEVAGMPRTLRATAYSCVNCIRLGLSDQNFKISVSLAKTARAVTYTLVYTEFVL